MDRLKELRELATRSSLSRKELTKILDSLEDEIESKEFAQIEIPENMWEVQLFEEFYERVRKYRRGMMSINAILTEFKISE